MRVAFSNLLNVVDALIVGVLMLAAGFASADEAWDRFRGPNGSGVSEATTIPTTWTEKDYNWIVDLPGGGISSPVIWKDKLFITAADAESKERHLLCYYVRDGKLLWKRGVPFTKEKKHLRNSYATGTPAVDGERVYTVWQSRESSQILAFDHNGRELWKYEVGPYKSGHGGGISPIVIDGVVAINNVQDGDSSFVGVNAATGHEMWRVKRHPIRASYSTPCVYTGPDGQRQLIFTGWYHGMTGVDPLTGKVLWESEVFERDGEEKRAIGSPFTDKGIVYGTCGFTSGKKFLAALRPNASEDPELVFRIDRNITHMPSALTYQGLLYLWTDAGIVACVRADTGKTIWQQRLGGNFSGSPICVGGKLYCLSEDAEMVVLKAGDKFEELARVKLDEGSSSTPAVSDGVMYFRTSAKLYSLGGKK